MLPVSGDRVAAYVVGRRQTFHPVPVSVSSVPPCLFSLPTITHHS